MSRRFSPEEITEQSEILSQIIQRHVDAWTAPGSLQEVAREVGLKYTTLHRSPHHAEKVGKIRELMAEAGSQKERLEESLEFFEARYKLSGMTASMSEIARHAGVDRTNFYSCGNRKLWKRAKAIASEPPQAIPLRSGKKIWI